MRNHGHWNLHPGEPQHDTIVGLRIPLLIISDAAYPLREWLMRPYHAWVDTWQQHFNTCLAHARNIIECAFGHLEVRWQCLTARLSVAEEYITPVIVACAVLHNMCEEKVHILPQDPYVGQPLPVLPRMQTYGILTGSSRSWGHLYGTPLQST